MRVRDPQGEKWTVRRRWLPWRRRLPGVLFADQPGDETHDPVTDRALAYTGRAMPSGVGLVRLAAPVVLLGELLAQLVLLPFTVLGRAVGLRWTVEARYDGARYHEDRVQGWAASRDRVREIAADVEQGRWPRRNVGRLPIGDDGSVPTSRPPPSPRAG